MLEQIFLEKYFWIFKIVIGLILLLLFPIILTLIFKLIKHKTDINKIDWKKNINIIFHYPIKILIWIIITYYILSVIARKFDLTHFLSYLTIARDVAIVINISFLFIKWKKEFQKQIIIKWYKQIDRNTIDFLGKILTFIIVFISFLLILQILGLNIIPLIAFGGVGAAGVAFAAKDVIANFFGSIMIHLTRPFVKGEKVEITSQNIVGVIESIGWYNTCIKDLDKNLIYVPNNIFSSISIKNTSRRTHRKFEEIIKIKYLDLKKIMPVVEEIKKLLSENKYIDSSLGLSIFLTDFSEYSLDVNIKVYTYLLEDNDYFEFRQNLLFSIQNVLDKNGIESPYPTTSIHFLNNLKN